MVHRKLFSSRAASPANTPSVGAGEGEPLAAQAVVSEMTKQISMIGPDQGRRRHELRLRERRLLELRRGEWMASNCGNSRSGFPGLCLTVDLDFSVCRQASSASHFHQALCSEGRSRVMSAYASSSCAVCPSRTIPALVLSLQYSRHCPDMSATASLSGSAPVSVTHAGRQCCDAALPDWRTKRSSLLTPTPARRKQTVSKTLDGWVVFSSTFRYLIEAFRRQ